MSELIYLMECLNPKCKTHKTRRNAEYIFSGSGTKGECITCDYTVAPKKSYRDFPGRVLSYNG